VSTIAYIPDDPIVHRFDYRYIKRLLDIIGSLFLIILFIPVYVVIAILIKFDSTGPILYEWNTTGKNGVPFKGWKFRTMVPDAEQIKVKLKDKNEMVGPVFKIKDDPRITKVGKFLRRYSLDESIQFVCVLKGDMSLVGPRPAGAFELVEYKEWQMRRMSVMSGLTGPWQVSPDITLIRLICHSLYSTNSKAPAGRGPTRLISPFKTQTN
jgi:lipopolysaccharide/colanic/teichoic acid biosynthesis glycosyltransferase